MCGLTGFWQFKENSQETLKEAVQSMSEVIISRGPDAYGDYVSSSDGLAIGHRRLSIIDLSEAGSQPMSSHNGRFVIAYNGELYNADEIRIELKKQGASFKGHSDTEVLVEACALWGIEKSLKQCNGMFALALWDTAHKRLFLARDRVGIKPLYWGFHHGTLFFGSQSGCFTKHPHWDGQIDTAALASYFNHNYIRQPDSIYKGIKQVTPGEIVQVDCDKQVKAFTYWSLDEVVNNTKKTTNESEESLENRLDALLKDAVKRRMIADVPLGAFLSGGIDSSTVVAMMQAQSNKPIKTFSIGFKEDGFNEAQYAKQVAAHLGTDHYEHYFSSQDAFKLIPYMPSWYDEPFADSSQLPTYLVSSLAKQHVTVALSGDGGDELFAGYNRYVLADKYLKRLDVLPLSIRKKIGKGIQSLKPSHIENMSRLIPQKMRPRLIADKAYKLAGILQVDRHAFYRNLVSLWPEDQSVVNGEEYARTFPASSKSLSFIEEMQFADTLMYLPDDILTKVDRASMAVSLEARVPLLDYRLLEFAWSLPMKYKLHKGKGKRLLRQVLNRYVPEALIDRPKMGFGVPIGDWLRGPLREWAEDLLSSAKLEPDGLLNRKLILERWDQHCAKSRNWEYSIWGVLMFQAWREQWRV